MRSSSNMSVTCFQIKYRDEHSAPFSWKTRSQQDLALDSPRQGCGSVSAWSALIWVAGSGSGSRRAKMTHKNRKSTEFSCFWSVGCSLLRAERFSCSLGVLCGLGTSKLQFLVKKLKIKYPAVNFFQFKVIRPWILICNPDPESGFAILKKCWIRIRIRIRIKSMLIRNPGPRRGSTTSSSSTPTSSEDPAPAEGGLTLVAARSPADLKNYLFINQLCYYVLRIYKGLTVHISCVRYRTGSDLTA